MKAPAQPLPAGGNSPAPEETPAAASKADVASARCAGSSGDKAAVEGALGRRPLQESRAKDDRKERDVLHTERASSASESLCAGAPDLALLPEMMQH